MATNKAIRSNSSVQPSRRRSNPHLKAELFDNLRQLNRGYGVSLAALARLQNKTQSIFPAACLHDYRNRTEALRALANRDLLRLLAGHEDHDASRFTKHNPPSKPVLSRRS